MMPKRRFSKILLFAVFILIGTELVLRLVFDLGEKPLYQADKNCEYFLKPHQNISRFHNNYQTNSYGMRAKPISKHDKKRILLIGDSVLNGGTEIDQAATLPYVLEIDLENYYADSVGVYAASAGSWGIENGYQFMINQVDFKSDIIGLFINSHDYTDNMHFRQVVGIQPAWPVKQPLTATGDLLFNGIIPKLSQLFGFKQYDYLEGFDNSKENPGLLNFIRFAQKNKLKLIVYMHPEKSELHNKAFNKNGNALLAVLKENDVTYINGMDVEIENDYVDNIHVNANGHLTMEKSIMQSIIKFYNQ